jgi:AraC family transcriptional regulator
LKKLPIPAYKYKVFRHDGHVTQLSSTIEKLCGMGVVTPSLPRSEGKSLGLLEYYGEHFNPQTGLGDMEVWVPFKE